MSAAIAEPVVKEQKENQPDMVARQTSLIHNALPDKSGRVKRICFLWNNHYRVNYHQEDGHRYIDESYFVSFSGDNIKADKEVPPERRD